MRHAAPEMIRSRRRPAAIPIALAITLALVGACIPPPIGRATATPATSIGLPATPTPTPSPTGPTPSPSFIRPTPTPLPTFLSYVVRSGDTLTSIARAHGTTPRSIAFWNRTTHPSLDPDSPDYEPDRIEVGWILLLVPDVEIDEDETFQE